MASGVAGCGPVGAWTVRSAVRFSRLNASDTAEYVMPPSVTVGVERAQRRCRLRPPDDRTGRASSAGAADDRILEPAGGMDRVDEPPFNRPLALDAFHQRAEHVGEIAPNAPLVDEAGQPAGAGEHAQQRRLRQADRRIAIVDQQNLVAGERELVAAAGAGAVDRRQECDSGIPARVLHRQPGLVGELAEIHLRGVGRFAQHHDVGAGAEDPLLQAGDDDGVDLGVLEADALQGVGQLDVDGQVVRVQLEPVLGPRARRPRERPSTAWRWLRRRPASNAGSGWDGCRR